MGHADICEVFAVSPVLLLAMGWLCTWLALLMWLKTNLVEGT